MEYHSLIPRSKQTILYWKEQGKPRFGLVWKWFFLTMIKSLISLWKTLFPVDDTPEDNPSLKRSRSNSMDRDIPPPSLESQQQKNLEEQLHSLSTKTSKARIYKRTKRNFPIFQSSSSERKKKSVLDLGFNSFLIIFLSIDTLTKLRRIQSRWIYEWQSKLRVCHRIRCTGIRPTTERKYRSTTASYLPVSSW